MDGSLFTFFHSLLRYGALLTILLAGVLHLRGYLARRPILNGERSLAIIAVVICHIQLAIGLLLYFTTKSYALDSSSAEGRFWKMEHIGVMVIAIILVTVGRSLSKRARKERVKQLRVWTFYLIALALMLWATPWPFREIGHGRGWI
jgi:cell division protein FtsW (lipid II flippase)